MTHEEHKLISFAFSVAEIEATGTPLSGAPFDVLHALTTYRKLISLPIYLVKGGLTTGDHEEGSWHYKKKAVDFTHGAYGIILDKVVEKLLQAGFRGIGCYWNGSVYSFHADLRREYEFWRGSKEKVGEPWKYSSLINWRAT